MKFNIGGGKIQSSSSLVSKQLTNLGVHTKPLKKIKIISKNYHG
jgi:hypothetical protein